MKSVFIGFDFSMNKPACTLLFDKQFYHFIWPLDMSEKHIKIYQDAGVFVKSRGLSSVSTNDKNSNIVLEHTIRSYNLANMIFSDLDNFIKETLHAEECPIYVSSEGLSYGSNGDAALNLATYKGVLLAKLYEGWFGKMFGLYTYAPITLKSSAGQAGKNKIKTKTPMIDAFMKESIDTGFKRSLINGDFINKTAHIHCVDDIVDSYWALITMLKKEGFVK